MTMPRAYVFRGLSHWLAAVAVTAAASGVCADSLLFHVEAEGFTASGGGSVRVIERQEASGGETVSYWETPGVWIEIPVTVPRDGTYVLALRYALRWPEAIRKISLDGEEVGVVSLPTTGSWADFVERDLTLPPLQLSAGSHVVRLQNHESVGVSLDRLTFHTTDVYLSDRRLNDSEADRIRSDLPAPVGGLDPLLRVDAVSLAGAADAPDTIASVCVQQRGLIVAPSRKMGAMKALETPNFRLLTGTAGGSEAGAGPDRSAWITDGASLVLFVLSRDADPVSLPFPVLTGDGVLPVQVELADESVVNLSVPGWRKQSSVLAAAGLHIAATAPLILQPWPAAGRRAGRLSVVLTPWKGWHVAMVRYCVRREEVGVSPIQESAGDRLVFREAAQRFPTLATFYGEGLFDMTVLPDGAVSFRDVTAEVTIPLWPAAGERNQP